MAGPLLGVYGPHKVQFSRHLKQLKLQTREEEEEECYPQTVWVSKRYIPIDLRSTAPVPRYKIMSPQNRPTPPNHWIPTNEAPLRSYECGGMSELPYVSQPSTRCEEWSSLRQMLPSSGRAVPHEPPNWGTGTSTPPKMTSEIQRRFSHVNSPMTRYVDHMHLTNRLFRLH
ncbi:uncharacterized protein LOC135484915 [Lineus longissimus]|uniref:uncharacterized protein LOC135484915 n=1 Tax=Lineus longissimus TaxID=88925 RepID=UPI002B4EAC10